MDSDKAYREILKMIEASNSVSGSNLLAKIVNLKAQVKSGNVPRNCFSFFSNNQAYRAMSREEKRKFRLWCIIYVFK